MLRSNGCIASLAKAVKPTVRRDSRRIVLMVGPSMALRGGMTEVVRLYAAKGIFETWPARYIETYHGSAPQGSFWRKPGIRGSLSQLRTWLPALWRVFALLVQRRVALVHVHSAQRGSFWRKSGICALASLFRVPYVFHLHSGKFHDFYARECGYFAQAWVRNILRNATRIIVLSRHGQDEVHKIEPGARVTIIRNPMNVPDRIPPLRRPGRTVLFLNWLDEEKGIYDLVRAIPEILRAVPEADFILAGAGEIDSIRHLMSSLNIESAVELPGWVEGSEKDDLLRAADVFVLPSYYEGMPMGVLESMACGIPVVATSVGGVPDVIEDHINGLLVEPRQPEALARAIITVLTDDALRSRLREAAHDDVRRRYSPASVIEDLGMLYRELGFDIGLVKRPTVSNAT